MKRLREVDVVIVGGGWNGLLMAKELATRTALHVVVLERGGPRRSRAGRICIEVPSCPCDDRLTVGGGAAFCKPPRRNEEGPRRTASLSRLPSVSREIFTVAALP